jgi:hypothetical protein
MMSPWARETPLIAGIGAGCFGMWWHGRAFVPMGWPAGFDWERYLRETWAHLNPGTMNSTWLEPLYSSLLGGFGDVYGFAWTALVISSISVLGVVAGAGLLGRALGGPCVGGLAAIAIPLTPQLASAARWVNLYPLLSATTALGLAGCVAFARWPKWYWACFGGAFIGLAWAVDGRTITLLPGMILLALMGVMAVRGTMRRASYFGLFACGVAIGPISSDVLRVVPRESTAQVAEVLRGIELSKLRNSPNPALRAACATEPSEVINLAGLVRPCSAVLAQDNASRVDEGLPFGLLLTLFMLPLALLPAGQGRRQTTVAVLALIPFVGMTVVMSRWLVVTPRYMMQIAAPAAVIVPLAVVNLMGIFSRKRGFSGWGNIGLIALAAWLFRGGPAHPALQPLEASSTYEMMAPVLKFVQSHSTEGTVFLDCSESHVEAALLPHFSHGLPQNIEGHDWPRCARWLVDPEGAQDAFILVGDRTQIPGQSGLSLPPPWQEVLRSVGQGQSVRIWKLDAAFNPEP